MFKGGDKLEGAFGVGGAGKYLKLDKGKPVQIEVLEYLGQQESQKFPGVKQYVFQIKSEGKDMRLAGSWRLAKALQDASKVADGPFSCKLTRNKVIEEVNGQERLINTFTAEDIVGIEHEDDETPF